MRLMKIFVGIPTYDGKLPISTVRALLNEQAAAALVGDELEVRFLPGCSLIPMARNQLAQEFVDSDCDRLVFIDGDLAWEPGAVLKVAHHPVDFCGGAYRYKSADENYPVGFIQDRADLWSNELGLIEVAALPGGFMSLSRAVFARLQDAHPDEHYEHFGHTAHAWFQSPFMGGRLCGEDGFFCLRWRNLGGQIWLDPELTLTHIGGSPEYTGHIGNWLKARATDGVS